MLPKHLLSSLDIGLVTNNTRSWISSKQLAQTNVVPTFSQDIQRGSALTSIVRHLVLIWFEKLSKMLGVYPKYLWTSDLFDVLLELLEIGRPEHIQLVHIPLAICLHGFIHIYYMLNINYNMYNSSFYSNLTIKSQNIPNLFYFKN